MVLRRSGIWALLSRNGMVYYSSSMHFPAIYTILGHNRTPPPPALLPCKPINGPIEEGNRVHACPPYTTDKGGYGGVCCHNTGGVRPPLGLGMVGLYTPGDLDGGATFCRSFFFV